MNSVLNTVVLLFNRSLGTLVDWVMRVLAFLSPIAALTIIAAVAGVILVFAWGKVSNQKRIRAVKQQMHARLLEAIVFRHDIRVSLKAQAGLLGLSLKYLSCALVPLVILGVPCVLVMAQLNKYYGYESLIAGQQAIVDVTVNSPNQLKTLSAVTTPENLLVEGPVRIPKDNRAVFRISGVSTGVHPLSLRVGNEPPQTVNVSVANSNREGIEADVSRNWYSALLHPALRSAPASGSSIESVSISYLPAKFQIFNFNLSWEIIFFGVSIISGFVIGKLLRIEL